MRVILLETIGKLGGLGDIANVKSGYARNFLIPQGKVKSATVANMAEFETIRTDLEAKEMMAAKTAIEKAEAMAGVICTLKANASEEGKLFGSISTADIIASLAELGHEVERRNINLSEVIHYIGEYDINITLHANVDINIKIVVESSEG